MYTRAGEEQSKKGGKKKRKLENEILRCPIILIMCYYNVVPFCLNDKIKPVLDRLLLAQFSYRIVLSSVRYTSQLHYLCDIDVNDTKFGVFWILVIDIHFVQFTI